MAIKDLISQQRQKDLYIVQIWLEDTVNQIKRYKFVPDELREMRNLLLQLKHDIDDRVQKYQRLKELEEKYKRRYL